MILGIDPGASTGLAILLNGKLDSLETLTPDKLLSELRDCKGMDDLLVIFEDSRQQPIFSRGTNAAAAGRIARSVGMIDGQCRDIEAVCRDYGIKCIGISPRRKGMKLNAKQFSAMTGWVGRANQHERDACAVAWPYRNARIENI